MIGCVIAMESEAEILTENFTPSLSVTLFGKTVRIGRAFGKEVLLVVTGEGKVNAALGAAAALSLGADLLLNFGVAGGLSPNVAEVANVYLVEGCIQYDFDLTQLSGGKVGTLPDETDNLLPALCPASLPLFKRVLGTGDRFNDSAADNALLLSLGCALRDMEGGAIAQAAKAACVPFVSVKAVSDVYGSGSTTEQFTKNLRRALCALKARLPEIFAALPQRVDLKTSETIPSFEKNHDALLPGLYPSPPQNGIITFDLRFKKPNAGDYLAQGALHSIEHLLATTLRNSEKKEHIVYFGPMGCRTGFYLLTADLTYSDVLQLLKDCIRRALQSDEVPGAKREQCGNCLEHDLAGAKRELVRYLGILEAL